MREKTDGPGNGAVSEVAQRVPRGWEDERLLGTLQHPGEMRRPCRDHLQPIAAYSEFMPAPRPVVKPSGMLVPFSVINGDPFGWPISEYHQQIQIAPGLSKIGERLAQEMRRIGEGRSTLAQAFFEDNPYWPEELALHAGSLDHERFVTLLPVALSCSQDDKGRVRWTLYGASELGPSTAFWSSFFESPEEEREPVTARAELTSVLRHAFGPDVLRSPDLAAGGLRILPAGPDPDFPEWHERLPSWATKLVMDDGASLSRVRFVLTFRPFERLPAAVRKEYLAGRLHLVPFPGSLLFFGHRGYRALSRELPDALQIGLLHLFPGRHVAPTGLRILQSGWLDEPHAKGRDPAGHLQPQGRIVTRVKRSHRFERTRRDAEESDQEEFSDGVSVVLFSSDSERLGLYGKPMARNAQIWTHRYELVLDGPSCDREMLFEASRVVDHGGHFGYRFVFPQMAVGPFRVTWHRPLVTVQPPGADKAVVLTDGLTGHLEARRTPGEGPGIETARFWPRLANRPTHVDAIDLFEDETGHRRYTTTFNVRKLLEARELYGNRLPISLARSLLTVPHATTVEGWLESLEERASDPARARRLEASLRETVSLDEAVEHGETHTYRVTATRPFEERYWRTIADLAAGTYLNKNNADPVSEVSRTDQPRDLDALARFLVDYHQRKIADHDMSRRAIVGSQWFRWRTEFDYPWSSGWSRNQTTRTHERNLLVVIPGRDRSRAVIMADHYDTAYMEDVFGGKIPGASGRRAAAGADDNHSATAALMLAADVILPLAHEDKLAHDVWLVHLTGEEFPSDCLGARNLVERLLARDLAIHSERQGPVSLAGVEIVGACVLDMVAHSCDRRNPVFQISPGEGLGAFRLAVEAHRAAERWNRSVPAWNERAERRTARPYARSADPETVPDLAPHPVLSAEIRPPWHFASSLFNTDAMIFSDAGLPVILLMEDYDIDRQGYHDTHDTMANIDLDYGSALVSIAIETVVSVAAADRSA